MQSNEICWVLKKKLTQNMWEYKKYQKGDKRILWRKLIRKMNTERLLKKGAHNRMIRSNTRAVGHGHLMSFLANVNPRSCSLYAIAVPSVCRLSSVCLWRSCALLSRLKFSVILLRLLVPWPSIDIHWTVYGDRPGEPLLGWFKRKRGSEI